MTPHWANTLPSHWKVRKLKYLAEVRLSNADKKSVEGEQSVRLCNYVDVYKNDFIISKMPFMEATATDVQVRELALRAGDVLITKDSEEWSDIAVPAFVPADLPGVICGYHLAHLRPDPEKMFGGYLFRAFTAQGIADQFKVAANGITRYGISKDDIAAALFPVPPLLEQHAIAEFLDRKTAEIDAVIVKKKHLIGLLRDERRAMIARAVTRGLDAGTPTKESGLWWLPRVPVHWQVCRNNWLFRERDERGNPDLPLLVVSINRGVVLREFSDERIERVAEDFGSYKVAREGDLAFNRMRFWQGAIGAVPTTGLVSPDYGVAECLPDALAAYYQHVFRTVEYQVEVNRYSHGLCADRNRLYWEEFKSLMSPVPPLAEQRTICDFIDRETCHINGLIAKNEQQIAKLREYRQALISAAVTGKLTITRQPAIVPTPVTAPQPAVAVPATEPAKKPANAFFRRSVFAAEIIDRLHDEPTFGHVKFQKVFFVAQHHLQVGDFEENYHRQAAGPHDNKMIRSVDSQLEKQKWFAARPTDGRYVYEKLAKAGGHRQYFDRYFGQQAPALDEVLAIFRTMTTEQAEIVATLYAVWNDFLLLGEPFDDARIIDDVLNNWHESKQKIGRDRWQKALGWMREKGLVPHGFGKPTRQGGSAATAGEAGGPNNESGD